MALEEFERADRSRLRPHEVLGFRITSLGIVNSPDGMFFVLRAPCGRVDGLLGQATFLGGTQDLSQFRGVPHSETSTNAPPAQGAAAARLRRAGATCRHSAGRRHH